MAQPLVSVIIPTYNGARFLGRAIRSVLDQTYPDFELIIVDDKSPDDTEEVVKQFNDARIKYIRHEVNQGAASARGTGRRHSSGEIIAFLDQDDRFHPEKLEAHVVFLREHPDVGFTYNPYFELLPSSDTIRTVFQPPKQISLAELTVGFYLPPSSWVVRREWAFQEDIWDAHTNLNGREIVVCGRLFMAGCKFARIDRVLHYRGYHAGRKFSRLEKNCEEEIACQEIILSDPRCPAEITNLRSLANTVIYLMWVNDSFNQQETELGHKLLRQALQVNPYMFLGNPSLFLGFLMGYCVDDESQDYEAMLEKIFLQLPREVPTPLASYFWSLPRGLLVRGVRALLWDRPEDASRYFSLAAKFNFVVDDEFAQQVTHELIGYELCYGEKAVAGVLAKLRAEFRKIRNRQGFRWVKSSYLVNKANRHYQDGHARTVPGAILGAIASRPKYLFDRGTISTLVKSLTGIKPVSAG